MERKNLIWKRPGAYIKGPGRDAALPVRDQCVAKPKEATGVEDEEYKGTNEVKCPKQEMSVGSGP